MFRKMRRSTQQITDSLCKKLLSTQWRGVLSLLGDNGYPYGVPMNFYYDECTHKIYFHGAKAGHKIDAIKNCDKCSFTVFDKGVKRADHWSLDITSVIVFGRISVVEDKQLAAEMVRKLAEKYFPDKAEIESEMQAHFARAACLELSIEHMTGKTINES